MLFNIKAPVLLCTAAFSLSVEAPGHFEVRAQLAKGIDVSSHQGNVSWKVEAVSHPFPKGRPVF